MTSGTPYDDAFRTLLNDCSALILPVLNEAFGEHYDGSERIEFAPNEHFLSQRDGDAVERITDSCFLVFSADGAQPKRYHAEIQSTEDGKILIRIFEYDAQIALDSGEFKKDTLTVAFPRSILLALRTSRNTPDQMTIRMEAPDGQSNSYAVPVIKVPEFSAEELFQKKLFFLLPFYLFRYEKEFDACERDAEKLQTLVARCSAVMQKLEALQGAGEMDEFTRHAIMDMAKEVTRHLTKKHEHVWKGVEPIMGGKILNYEAKDILNRGRAEGKLDMVIELLRAKQPLELIAKVYKFSVERIAEIGKEPGLVVQP